MLLAIGLVLVAVAVGLLFVARSQNKKDRQLAVVETLTAAELVELQKTAAEAVGEGSFAQMVEVVGAAAPGDAGLLTAPESGKEAVWHRTTITEHYYDYERDSDGDRRRVQKTRTLSSSSSSESFSIQDKTGAVVVTIDDADIDEAPKTFDRMEKSVPKDMGSGVIASVAEAFSNWNDDTIGIQREEWSLRPGQRLFVHGEVSDKAGRLEFGKSDGHPYMISTRTEEEMRKSAQKWGKIWAWGALGCGILGVLLTIAGAIVLIAG
jgi:hypothetical protein